MSALGVCLTFWRASRGRDELCIRDSSPSLWTLTLRMHENWTDRTERRVATDTSAPVIKPRWQVACFNRPALHFCGKPAPASPPICQQQIWWEGDHSTPTLSGLCQTSAQSKKQQVLSHSAWCCYAPLGKQGWGWKSTLEYMCVYIYIYTHACVLTLAYIYNHMYVYIYIYT